MALRNILEQIPYVAVCPKSTGAICGANVNKCCELDSSGLDSYQLESLIRSLCLQLHQGHSGVALLSQNDLIFET